MTDPHLQAGNTGPGTPAPTFFDPSFERLPAPVAGENAVSGSVLLVFDRTADREWVADAAVALATGWHAAGRRTVLADLCLEDPFLNDRIGMPNQEGVVDIFLYGASLARTARVVPGRGFYLISAGTYTPDAGAVLRHPRWEKIVEGFRDATAALLLFVPADAPELDALARWADDAVLLGAAGGTERIAGGELADVTVRAWVTPPRRDGAPARAGTVAPGERFPEPEPVPPWQQAPGTHAPPPPPPREGLPTATAAVGAPAASIPVPEPGWKEEPAKAPPRRRVSPLLLVLLALAVLAALVLLGPRYISGFPDLLGAAPTASLATEAEPAPTAREPAEVMGASLPYSVHVAGHQTWPAAADDARNLARRYPEAQFFVAPEVRDGIVYWLVFAGMAGDTTEVLALRDRLLAEDVIDEQSVGGRYGLIQARPLTFDLGEFPNALAARARVDSLAARNVPAYVAPVPYSDGSERWKVYAGAYRDSTAAQSMRRVLEVARLPSTLVERTGRPPASPK